MYKCVLHYKIKILKGFTKTAHNAQYTSVYHNTKFKDKSNLKKIKNNVTIMNTYQMKQTAWCTSVCYITKCENKALYKNNTSSITSNLIAVAF